MRVPLLLPQARVWATLARAASDRRQTLSAYAKAVDTLEGHFERVDYVVEVCVVVSSIDITCVADAGCDLAASA